MTWYNDNDKNAAAWLRELIEIGALPDGTVDDRDIRDINPRDIHGQSHFFAGIGGWPCALKLADWPATRPVWTASLPCQPFSQAGQRRGTKDERHLWPVFQQLVEECRPPVILGEQVASKDGRAWFAAIRADLEELGYAVGAADLCAAGIGAPHIRQRLYWVGISDNSGPQRQRYRESRESERQHIGRAGCDGWSNVDWIPCAEGKIRPLEPGLVPLVDGLPADVVRGGDKRLAPNCTAEGRTLRLRGYGSAIVPQLAAAFVETVMEYLR